VKVGWSEEAHPQIPLLTELTVSGRTGYKDFAPTELVHGPYRIGAEDRLTIFNRPVRFCVREILRGGHPGLKPWAVMYSRFRLRPIAPF
jgi:hypothetical protein